MEMIGYWQSKGNVEMDQGFTVVKRINRHIENCKSLSKHLFKWNVKQEVVRSALQRGARGKIDKVRKQKREI